MMGRVISSPWAIINSSASIGQRFVNPLYVNKHVPISPKGNNNHSNGPTCLSTEKVSIDGRPVVKGSTEYSEDKPRPLKLDKHGLPLVPQPTDHPDDPLV